MQRPPEFGQLNDEDGEQLGEASIEQVEKMKEFFSEKLNIEVPDEEDIEPNAQMRAETIKAFYQVVSLSNYHPFVQREVIPELKVVEALIGCFNDPDIRMGLETYANDRMFHEFGI